MRSRAIAFAGLAVICIAAAVAAAAIAVVGAGNDRKESERAVAAARPKAEQILAGGKPFAVFRAVDKQHAATYGRVSIAALHDGVPGPAVLAGPDLLARRGRRRQGPLPRLARNVDVGQRPGSPAQRRSPSAPGRGSEPRADLSRRALGRCDGVRRRARLRGAGHVLDGHHDHRPQDRQGRRRPREGRHGHRPGHGRRFARSQLLGADLRGRRRHVLRDARRRPEDVADQGLDLQGPRARRSTRTWSARRCRPTARASATRRRSAHDPTTWRFTVLDLATGTETPLAETRSVDDQLAWLDDAHLLYSDGETHLGGQRRRQRPSARLAARDGLADSPGGRRAAP